MNLPHTVNNTLNPEATPFFPGRRNHRVAESTASTGQRIQPRSVPNQMPSVSGTPSRHHSTPTTGRNISYPHYFKSQIDQGFKLLNEKRYKEAEELAKRIQANNQGHRNVRLTTLHARSLIGQGSHRAKEAASILQSHHRFIQPDNSIVLSSNFYINMTMAFVFESLKQYSWAEDILTKMNKQVERSHSKKVQLALVRLQQANGAYDHAKALLQEMRRKHSHNNDLMLTEPCGHYELDLAMVRHQEANGAYDQAETLLQEMRRTLSANSTLTLTELCGDYKLDLAMVRLQEANGAYDQAETLLQEMRRKHSSNSTLTLTEPCDHYELDLVMVRLQQENGAYDHAKALLQQMRRNHSRNSALTLTEPCDHYELDLAMVRLQQENGGYDQAKTLLQQMRRSHSLNHNLMLTERCGDYKLDLGMVRLQEANGAYDHAETLLQQMRRKHSRNSALTLTEPCDHYELDLVMVRLQEANGAYDHAKALLQQMRRKHSRNSAFTLTEPCDHYELDLAMVRLQQENGAYDHAETLLQKMRRKHSSNSALTLTELCGDYKLDLAMVRLQEANGAYDQAKALLQKMRRKHSSNTALMLTEPCGHYELDLAMVRHIDVSNTKNINLDRYFDSYPDSHNFALERLSVCLNKKEWQKHDGLAKKLPDSPEKLLSCAIRYFQEFTSSYLSAGETPGPKSKESIDRLLKQSLDITQFALRKYPCWSALISHEGHCLRMLGEAEEIWKERFERASKLDPNRLWVEKNQHWRSEEHKVLRLKKLARK